MRQANILLIRLWHLLEMRIFLLMLRLMARRKLSMSFRRIILFLGIGGKIIKRGWSKGLNMILLIGRLGNLLKKIMMIFQVLKTLLKNISNYLRLFILIMLVFLIFLTFYHLNFLSLLQSLEFKIKIYRFNKLTQILLQVTQVWVNFRDVLIICF